MTRRQIQVTGTVTDPQTIRLDEALPADVGQVRLLIDVLPPPGAKKPTMQEAIAEIRARQAARGHVPPSTEEIEAHFRDVPTDDEDPE